MELNEAAQHYERERPGLGKAFLDGVSRSCKRIEEHPEANPVVRGSVRRRRLLRFSYALLYSLGPAEIRILAVMNLRRRPTYWVDRS